MIELMLSLPPKEKLKLIAVMLLTDGSAYLTSKYRYPKIKYYGKDKILHEIFIKLIRSIYCTTPSITFLNGMETCFGRKEHLTVYKDLAKLSTSYNKSSHEVTICFLNDSPPFVQAVAIRLAMSAEGSISISRKKKGTIRAHLAFACANARLCKEWAKLFARSGINMKIQRDSNTDTKLHGLQTVNRKDIIAFQKLGGFIQNVKIRRGIRFKGFEKNVVLNAFCRFAKMVESKEIKEYSKLESHKFWEILNNLVRGCSPGVRG